MKIDVLDNGYVKLIEFWGQGEAGVPEAAIIEAARQSTQGNFRGWNIWHCSSCGNNFRGVVDHNKDGSFLTIRNLCENPKWSNDNKLLSFMFKNKHSTPFEFCGMTIEVQAPIFVLREWHRHRTQSYNEMSARYAPLPDLNYMPTKERLFLTQEKNRQAQKADFAPELRAKDADAWLEAIQDFYEKAEAIYQKGLERGVPKELARIALPVGRYSRMRATANLRNWLAFLTLRMHPDAQFEIRKFANAVGEIIKNEFPRTWELFEGEKSK